LRYLNCTVPEDGGSKLLRNITYGLNLQDSHMSHFNIICKLKITNQIKIKRPLWSNYWYSKYWV